MSMMPKHSGRMRVHRVLSRNGYGKGGAKSAAEEGHHRKHRSIAEHLAHAEGGEAKHRLDRKPRASGGKLTTKERNAIPGKEFALPGRRYPIENASHARNALARVSQFGTPEEKSEVRSAVHRKYPNIGKK